MPEAENCARCGSPLGSSVYPTEDGPVCHSCHNQGEDREAGVIDDWEYVPETETESELEEVHLHTDEDETVEVPVEDHDQAMRLGRQKKGHRAIDKGDQWLLKPSTDQES